MANSAGTLGRQIWAAFLQLATAAIIANAYGPEGTGMYAIALLLPTMGATFLSFGMVPANTYFIASRQYPANAVARKTLVLWIAVSVAGTILGYWMVDSFGQRLFPGAPLGALLVALACFPPALFVSLAGSIFQGLQDFASFNLSLTLQPLLNLIGVGLVVTLDAAPEKVLWAYLFASVSAMIVIAGVAVSKLRSVQCCEPSSYPFKVALSYGIKSHLSSIVSFLNYRIDIFLVNFLLGPAATGVYSVAVQIVEKLWLLSQAVSTALFPRLSASARDKEAVTEITSLVTRLTMAVTLVGGLALAFVGYYLISIVFGASFLGAYFLLLVLLPGAVAGAGVRLLSSEIAARGRPEVNLYMGVFVVLLNVLLNFFLIPLMGATGAALATTIAYGANLGVRLIVFRRITGARIGDAILPKIADAHLVGANVAKYFHRAGAKK